MFDEKLMQTATKLTEYCNTQQEAKGLDELYADECVSVEALDMPGGMGREAKGLEAIRGKHDWWYGQHEVHSAKATGPFFHAPDTFYLIFDLDVTNKESGDRMQMQEVGRYQVNANGQIIREEFSYPPMGG